MTKTKIRFSDNSKSVCLSVYIMSAYVTSLDIPAGHQVTDEKLDEILESENPQAFTQSVSLVVYGVNVAIIILLHAIITIHD